LHVPPGPERYNLPLSLRVPQMSAGQRTGQQLRFRETSWHDPVYEGTGCTLREVSFQVKQWQKRPGFILLRIPCLCSERHGNSPVTELATNSMPMTRQYRLSKPILLIHRVSPYLPDAAHDDPYRIHLAQN